MTEQSKVLILASGGLDSSVLLALYKSLNYDIYSLYIDYGNKNHVGELEHLAKIITKFNIEESHQLYHVLKIPWSQSSCIGGSGEEYVEMRNLIFISNAISIAQAKGINKVAVGFIKMEDDGYYEDTSPRFIENLNRLALESCNIQVVAPLHNLDKLNVYRLGKKLGVSLKDTFSCNFSDGKPCGKCEDCLAIKEIIKKEGIPDEDNPML